MSTDPRPSAEQPTLPLENHEEEFEVITSEEVDRVLDALDQLIATTQSENVRLSLEEAADAIYSLIYTDEELSDSDSEEQEEAA